MDEFDFYQGTHTGGEIDLYIGMVENRGQEIHDPSYFEHNGGSEVVSEWAVFKAIDSQMIEITANAITGSGAVSGSFSRIGPTSGFAPKITAQHKVIAYSFSNPSAVTGDWTITTNDSGSVTYSGSLNGTTDLTIILGSIGADVWFYYT